MNCYTAELNMNPQILNLPPIIGPTAGVEELDTPPTDGESIKQRLL
jgi:hypothetical protein